MWLILQLLFLLEQNQCSCSNCDDLFARDASLLQASRNVSRPNRP